MSGVKGGCGQKVHCHDPCKDPCHNEVVCKDPCQDPCKPHHHHHHHHGSVHIHQQDPCNPCVTPCCPDPCDPCHGQGHFCCDK